MFTVNCVDFGITYIIKHPSVIHLFSIHPPTHQPTYPSIDPHLFICRTQWRTWFGERIFVQMSQGW